MATKKNSFITEDLMWAENQLASWKQYVDDHPLHELKDRIEWKPTKNGGLIPMVISSIENQGKFIQETMKNYLALLETVDRLRAAEEAKIETRGKSELSGHASAWLKNRNGE